jgi:agmatinase
MPNRRDVAHEGRGAPAPATPGQVAAGLDDLPWELPHAFLGLDEAASDFETAGAVILPVPYESTTSYGGGTRAGPAAIIEASRYLELYDQEMDAEVGAEVGVHTLPAVELTRAGATPAMAELREVHDRVLEAAGERFVIMLGGEHSVSGPAILSHAERRSDRLTVLQMDAHADLRASYEGSPHSHASVMARVLDAADVVGVGLRAVSAEEIEVARGREGITMVWADDMWHDDAWMDRALAALGPNVYLSFDVDYFDPSLVPSTGTPEPGGGDWYRTLRFLRRVFAERHVVGCDVVELAPTPGLHAPNFLVAKLVYKLLAYRFQHRFAGRG